VVANCSFGNQRFMHKKAVTAITNNKLRAKIKKYLADFRCDYIFALLSRKTTKEIGETPRWSIG
jgi:hypothetical protein